MACDKAAFKAYDVRGTYPEQLDEAGAYAIGRAYVEHLGAAKLAVGRDMRTMAPSMSAALVRGMTDAGADVEEIGLVATEVLYHAVASRGLDGGIMVTASHNPGEYIGMKCVKRGAQPVGEEGGLLDVRDLALAFAASGAPEAVADGVTPGTVTQLDVLDSFRELVWGLIDPEAVRPLKVVVDAGNGVGAMMAMPLLERLPVELHAYNAEPDGTFPNHEPNPLLEENRRFLIEQVRAHGADVGIAFDGDADRCFFVDDTGEFVPGDFVTALLAELALRREPGARILYDVRASRAVPDTIERCGGTAVASRVGHAFIKARMRAEDAAFAGEISGHYYFRAFHGVDTGVVPALMLLQLVSECGWWAGAARRTAARALPHQRRDQLARHRRPGPDAAAQGDVRRRAHHPRRRRVDRLRRLALQRALLQHRAAAAPQPGVARVGRGHGATPGRGAGGHPLGIHRAHRAFRGDRRRGPGVSEPRHFPNVAGPTSARPPFRFSAGMRVAFSDTDAQGIVYYGRYAPYFDVARVEYWRRLGFAAHDDPSRGRIRHARVPDRVPRPRELRRRARGVLPGRADRAHLGRVRVRRRCSPTAATACSPRPRRRWSTSTSRRAAPSPSPRTCARGSRNSRGRRCSPADRPRPPA